MRLGSCLRFVIFACALPAAATDLNVIGLFPGKAVIVVDRGQPRTLAVGQRSPEGVLLVSTDSRAAVLEVEGKRYTIEMGQHFETPALTGSRNSVTLASNAQGHWVTDGQVNGQRVRFLVDTGATVVVLPALDAKRLGIDYRRGQRAISQTASGPVPVYRVRFDTVTVGDLTLHNVDGVVQDAPGLDIALLGASFLNRTEMRHEGANLTLSKRY